MDYENEYPEDWYGEDLYEEFLREELDFADPGGRSALRAGDRVYPCPTCHRENMLTAKDVSLHYQCDYCADTAEGYPRSMQDY